MFDELAEGVFRRQYDFLRLNVGVILGEDGVCVIDTRESLVAAAEFLEDICTLTSLPVRWIINTHWHWDHTFGNGVFTEATILGHNQCRAYLADRPEQARSDARNWMPESRHPEIDDVVIVPPNKTFEAVSSLDIGTRILELAYHGRGHTSSDILVHVGDVTFAGDLVEEGSAPNMAEAFLLDWPATLRAAEPEVGATVVPGHGDPGDHDWMVSQIGVMDDVAAHLKEVLYEGRPVEEAARSGPFSEAEMATGLKRGVAWAGTG